MWGLLVVVAGRGVVPSGRKIVVSTRSAFEDQSESSLRVAHFVGGLAEVARQTFASRRFWRIQWLVLALVVLHYLSDYLNNRGTLPFSGFIFEAALVVPAVLASTEFGAVGSLATSLGGSLLMLSIEFLETHTSHEVEAEWTILLVVVLTALLVGIRDDRLRAQRALFDLATESGEVAVWEYDVERNVMRRSKNHDALYGLAWQNPWRLETFLEAAHPDDRASAAAAIEQSLVPGGPDDYNYDVRVIWPDSTIHWLWVQGTVTRRDAAGRGTHVRGTDMVITQRKELELASRRLRMLYAALSECNQSVIYANDEMDLFERIVNATVSVGTAQMAWIGVFDHPQRTARPVASAGVDAAEFLAERRSIQSDSSPSAWPASEAATSGEIIIRPLARDDADELSRVGAAHGWRVVAALPISRRGSVVATLSLYSSEENFFNESLRPLFDEMVKDLSFALDLFEDQRLHQHSELALARSEERFRAVVEQSVVGIYLARNGRFELGNARAASMLGFDSVASMIGTSDDVIPASSDQQLGSDASYFIESEYEKVVTVPRHDGGASKLWISSIPIAEHGSQAQLGIIDDVTALVERDILAATHFREISSLLHATVSMATSISEQRDPYTAGHQSRVAEIAARLGLAMNLDADQIEGLRVAGQLHDIGKISIPAEILTRPGRLSDMERRLIQLHPQSGYDILCDIPFPWPVAAVALQHHERLDGSGYPKGLKGSDILFDARIIAVADVMEAMSSHRPYRASLGPEAAISEIESGAGSLYDADVAAHCVRLARSGQLLP